MPVQNLFASAATNPNTPNAAPLPSEVMEGHAHSLISTINVPVMDATSTISLGSIPSNARILRNSTVDFEAITGATSVDIGLGQRVGGVYVAGQAGAASLVAAADMHLAGSKAGVAAVAIADLVKAAWEIAGYADDPGGNLEIMATFNNAPTAAANLTATYLFATP